MDWKTFNLLQEDSTLLDLITIIGDPFPCHTPTPSKTQGTPTPSRVQGRGASSDGVQEDGGGGVVRSDSGTEPGPLIRVKLRTHEGVEGDQPFNVQPTQMVSVTYMYMHMYVYMYACICVSLETYIISIV